MPRRRYSRETLLPTMWAAVAAALVSGCCGGASRSCRVNTRCVVPQPGYCETSWSSLDSICGQSEPARIIQSSPYPSSNLRLDSVPSVEDQPEVLSLPAINPASAHRPARAKVSAPSFVQSASYREPIEDGIVPTKVRKPTGSKTQEREETESFDYFRP